ncbi:MAG: RDD family protein [Pseudomonadota bacterium]
MNSPAASALPDPVSQADFYAGVTFKRFFAWIFDVVVISVITAICATLPFFIGWFFLPFIFTVVYFFYCWGWLSSASATPGQRLFNIEYRGNDGQHIGTTEALMLTISYMVLALFMLPHIISIILILISGRGQGLHDLLAGAALMNRPSKY